MRDLLLEGREVDQRQNDDSSGNLGGIERLNHFFQRDDGRILRAVRTGNQRQYRARLCTPDYDHRN